MTSRKLYAPLALLLLTAPALRPARAQQLPRSDAELVASLDRIFLAIDSTTTPGCAVSIARRDMPTVVRSYGVRDLELPVAIDSNTVFEAGSVSKQFTAAALLLLSYDGRLSLDDDVRRWIPELSTAIPRVSIRQLLHHQAGVRDWGNLVEMSGWPRGTRAYAMADVVALIARQRALNFAPGAEYSYSNSNYVLAASIVERASGEPFAAFTARRLFAPLGMARTRWREDFMHRVKDRANAWSRTDAGDWQLDMPFENVIGHGGLLTTVGDLQRWQESFTRESVGGRNFTGDMQRAGVLENGRITSYALGLERSQEQGIDVVSHAGSTAGYRAYLGRNAANDVSVALLCNNGTLRSDLLGPQLLALANGRLANELGSARSSTDSIGPPTTNGALASLAGQYRNTKTGQAVELRFFRDGLTLDGWNVYRARSDRSGVARGEGQVSRTSVFVSEDGARTLSILDTPEGRPRNVAARFRIAYSARDYVEYERAEVWKPASRALPEFAGRFASEETSSTLSLRAVNDTLQIERRPGQYDAMRPLYRDTFAVPSQGWLVRFTRDASGRVTGLVVGATRMRALPFVKRSP